MKAQTIEVAVEATITPDTAQRCLRLLEMFLDDRPELRIEQSYQDDPGGLRMHLRFVEVGGCTR